MNIQLDAPSKTITVDGVKISLHLLKDLANAKQSSLFEAVRYSDTLYVRKVHLDE